MAEQGPEQGSGQAVGDGGVSTRWKKGQSGNPDGRPKRVPTDRSLPLDDRMVSILAEVWSDDDLKRLAKSDPANYQRLLTLAAKVRDQGSGRGVVAGSGGTVPPPPDESAGAVLELAEKLLADLAGKAD